jgi:hypothetical protein
VSRNLVMTSGRQVGYDMVALGIAAAGLGVGIAVLLARGSLSKHGAGTRQPAAAAKAAPAVTVTVGRRLNRAAGTLAFSVVADSSVEHYRGSFFNPVMYVPVGVSALVLAVSAHGVADQRPAAHLLRDFVYGAAAITGVAGTGFHIDNVIFRRPGEIAAGPSIRRRVLSRWWLRLTAAIGIAGVGFHAYGIHRNMGGWRNWRQNLLNGPPLPAPASFTGLALAGLAALNLLEEGRRA